MQLKEYSNKLIELYTEDLMDEDFVSFSLGKILGESEKEYLFLSISEYGFIESLQLKRKIYLAEIEDDTEYLDYHHLNIEFNKNLGAYDPYGIENLIDDFMNLSLTKTLEKIMNKKDIITLILANDDDYTGKIQMLEDNFLALSKVDYTNEKDNKTKIIKLDDIIYLDLASVNNILLKNYLSQ